MVPAQNPGIITIVAVVLKYGPDGISPLLVDGKVPEDIFLLFGLVSLQVE